jgi:hypothetical protein
VTPRCIAIPDRRCPRKASKRSGDLYLCTQHCRRITMLLIDDQYSSQTRRMLAFARWDTVVEGQALIDRLHRRKAA